LSYAYAEWLYPPPPDQSQCLHGCIPEPIGGRIHVADPRSGQDTVVYSYAGWPAYNVVGMVPGTIYLGGECNGSSEPGCDRLARLDVATGTVSVVFAQTGQQWHLHGSDVWLVTTDYARLLRVGLRDGTMETWLTKDFSDSMELIGFDGAGVPLVVLASQAPAPVFAVTSPGTAVQIFSAQGPLSETMNNQFGTWFAVVDNASPVPGLYLYSSRRGVRQISSLPVLPA
jgi:hypothetical protein